MNAQTQPAKIARQYAEQVVAGEILACQWVQRACQRQLDDLAKFKGKVSLPGVNYPELRHEHISISLIDAVLGSGTRRVRLKISLSGDRRRRLLLCKVQGSAFCGLSVPVACRFNMHE